MEEWRQLDALGERFDVPPALISFLVLRRSRLISTCFG